MISIELNERHIGQILEALHQRQEYWESYAATEPVNADDLEIPIYEARAIAMLYGDIIQKITSQQTQPE